MIKNEQLLSDQVSSEEIDIILREYGKTYDIAGDVTEFGCYVGTTSVFLARHARPDKTVWLYDSFEGLPPKAVQDESPAGLQFQEGELHATKKQLIANLRRYQVRNARIKKAWFNELTSGDVPGLISFAYLDGDYYHSVMDPLRLIEDRLAKGAMIVVDDYANEALPGAAKAVDEWLVGRNVRLRIERSLALIGPF